MGDCTLFWVISLLNFSIISTTFSNVLFTNKFTPNSFAAIRYWIIISVVHPPISRDVHINLNTPIGGDDPTRRYELLPIRIPRQCSSELMPVHLNYRLTLITFERLTFNGEITFNDILILRSRRSLLYYSPSSNLPRGFERTASSLGRFGLQSGFDLCSGGSRSIPLPSTSK